MPLLSKKYSYFCGRNQMDPYSKYMTTKWNFRIDSLYLIILCALLLTSCGSKSKKYIIGVSQCSMDTWREKLNSELKTAEYLNDSVEVRLASADDDNARQLSQINYFIDQGVSLLVVSPNQVNAISPALERAQRKGIPVVLVDRKTKSKKYTAFIGCDNYLLGKLAGNYIAQRLKGKGRVVEICGLYGSSPAIDRHRGFVDAMKAYPDMKIVASESGDWKEQSGSEAMNHVLGKTQDIDYVFSQNDRMAYGAYKVAREHGLQGKCHFVGVDGLAGKNGGLDLVRKGILEASMLYPTKGDEVIALAMKILRHEPFARDNYLPTSIVTQSNAELILMEAKDSEQQRNSLDMLHQKVSQYDSAYHVQRLFTLGLVLLVVLIVVVAVYMFRSYLIKTRLNEQLAQRNDELRRLNGEVLELTHSRLVFFTNISHELRTPLTLIADPVEMLLDDTSIKGRSRELLQMVKRNALSLQRLVNSILDFRKIQNGKMELQLGSFDLSEALRQWTGDFALTAQRKKINLQLDTTNFSSSAVVADKEKLARVVFNLLGNALKYTPAGGSIRVSLEDEGERLRLEVKDSGKGIDKEELAKVFDRFFQSKGATSGTGIGLALVKSFVELHHGEVRVESEPGNGTCFIIQMPRCQEGFEEGEQPVAADKSSAFCDDGMLQYIDDGGHHGGKLQQLICEHGEKPTLLIIDDNNDIRQYERTILQDSYFVLEASDGKEGLEMARKEVPDLVICDVMMPVMDGLEFTRQLKAHIATSHIPVIMLTAKNLEESRAKGYEQGADSYITKPFHSKVLLARVENLLRQRAHLRQLFAQGAADGKETEEMAKLDNRDKVFVKRLHDIIKSHMGNSDFGVEDIGSEIGLSRVQLYRKVKAITGSSVVDLLRKTRLAKARRLLEADSMNISEVAYEVGFSSPSYFTKCFKDEYGMLPGDVTRG